ncbi:hypothetical protein GCM10022200_05220 [Microbacterium awajiense]|uniref:Uncharacterized protein n=2 Tax=Microbacterium awajiense TaxID=415214 RepID=A0ABP7A6A7_9MICO
MSGVLGDATWRVLWPGRGSAGFGPGNDSSVVVEFAGGGIPSILLLGDLSASAQRAMRVASVTQPRYEVVKVAHHGSADQDATLYDDLGAPIGLISVGVGNPYGHPRAELISLLDAVGADVARTDLHGTIALWPAVDGVVVWRERVGDRG